MGLEFRQSFEVFPGVRLDLSGSGITASFGVDGATMNVGAQGVRSAIGIPGSGLSFTTNHCSPSGSPTPHAFVPTQGYAPTYAPVQPMREINSASVERLTSHSLVERGRPRGRPTADADQVVPSTWSAPRWASGGRAARPQPGKAGWVIDGYVVLVHFLGS
ncbi:DUF4236 domain-containing protein [Xanthomonas vasicola]|uniref:DUF4236 domain-containing protein n=1 Tax=Xanthomonas vasicola TaxID=56459 RepID=UPI001D0686F4|nr:DUF4236 domain-containing protein [Xanthomonas vasicola]